MKKIFSLVIMLLLFCCMAFIANAQTNPKIKETPTLKVIVDGVQQSNKVTPINCDGHTLLGLRSLLVALGVPNDEEHIIWNQTDKTIEIIKDSTKIDLTVGSKKAVVDGTDTELEVVPVIYKNNTYIPAKFIAQSLSKLVMWDAYTRSVIICDEEMYKKINSIPDPDPSVVGNIVSSVRTETYKQNNSLLYTINDEDKYDKEKKIGYTKSVITDSSGDTETNQYFDNDMFAYKKLYYSEKWIRTSKSASNNDNEDSKAPDVDVKTSLLACMSIGQDDSESLILEGDTLYFAVPLTKNSYMDVLKDKTSKCHVRMEYKASTHELKQIEVTITGSVSTEKGVKSYELKRITTYDLGADKGEVIVPTDLSSSYTLPDGYDEYYNKKDSYTLLIPSTWDAPSKNAESAMAVYVDSKNQNKWCGVSVERVFFGGANIPLSQIKQEVIKNLSSSMTNVKSKSENTKWKNYNAIKITITGKDKKDKANNKVQIIIADYQGQALIFTFIGEAKTFDQKNTEAQKIINSWTDCAQG
ncbi:MAG: stalk domain-containing protein [Bacillota bacterium]|nr:stalk domain-containing protein [Bacillota bacterium]